LPVILSKWFSQFCLCLSISFCTACIFISVLMSLFLIWFSAVQTLTPYLRIACLLTDSLSCVKVASAATSYNFNSVYFFVLVFKRSN
jgi:hypothetical protein